MTQPDFFRQGLHLIRSVAFIAMVAWCAGCQHPSPIDAGHPGTSPTASFRDISTFRPNSTESIVIDIPYDPVYQSPKQYRAVPISRILPNIPGFSPTAAADLVVEFRCKDGYVAVVDAVSLLGDRAYLAFGDTGALNPSSWIPITRGSAQVDPSPLYLVWMVEAKNVLDFAWPYGVVAIRALDRKSARQPAAPLAGNRAIRGYNLFQKHCMNCHSINGVGGALGVDLNVPRNVTEYWKREFLAEFVQNPSAFRNNSKMPAFPDLNRDKIADIIIYLEHMRTHKIETHR